MKNWNYLEFKFADNKIAYRFVRWLSFGKEIGLVPDGLEIQLDTKKVLIGYYGPKEK